MNQSMNHGLYLINEETQQENSEILGLKSLVLGLIFETFTDIR